MNETTHTLLLLAGFTALGPAALAQPADAPAAPEAPSPAAPARVEAQPAAPVPAGDMDAEAPAAEAPNALRHDAEEHGWLQGKLEALEEQYSETRTDVQLFKKLKFSGYVQARYTYLDATAPASQFFVRRGRLKSEYQGDWSRFMLQIDAVGGVDFVRDAEASFTEPWSGKQYVTLTAGLHKVPFGVEGPVSSVDREFPERSRMTRSFFPGERDRGLKAAVHVKWLWAHLGVYDGNFTQMTGFLQKDNDTEKDVTMRLVGDFRWIAVGASGVVGKTLKPADVARGEPARFLPRNRIGFDAQVYLDLLPFGGTALVGELVAGTSYWAGGQERAGQTALGWYVLLVQNVFEHDQIAVRYDFFDPATGTPNRPDAADPTRTSALNQVHTVGALYTHYFDDVFKASIAWEMPLTVATGQGDAPPRQNLLTVQMQARF